MRILMIIDGLPGGGAEKTVLTLSSGLTELGHQVTLFSLRKVCDYAIPEGIDCQIVQDTCKKPSAEADRDPASRPFAGSRHRECRTQR